MFLISLLNQGVDDVKIPTVEHKPLDLYALHKAVQDFGGFEKTCTSKKWGSVCKKVRYLQNYNILYRYPVSLDL